MVGTLEVLGSPYKNHWLLAYKYGVSKTYNTKYYRTVDNHGLYSKNINKAWRQVRSLLWIIEMFINYVMKVN